MDVMTSKALEPNANVPRRVAPGRRLLQVSIAQQLHSEVRRAALSRDMTMAAFIRTLCLEAVQREKPDFKI
jgi:hypothetical protein